MIVHRIAEEGQSQQVMAGSALGEKHIKPLLKKLRAGPRMDQPAEIVVLDFSGIEYATASYLRMTILSVLKVAGVPLNEQIDLAEFGDEKRNIYPILAGLSEDVRQPGVQEMLALRGLLCLEAAEWPALAIRSGYLRGARSGVAIDTLKALVNEGQATAALLHEKYSNNINITGWNNRLADLYLMRLARRSRQGKQWVYEPIVAEVING